MTKEDIKARLIQNDALFNNIYVVEQQFDILPDDRIHYGAAITYQDLMELRSDFLEQLVDTVVDWVYSSEKYADLKARFMASGKSEGAAVSQIARKANEKFRRGNDNLGNYCYFILFSDLRMQFLCSERCRSQHRQSMRDMEQMQYTIKLKMKKYHSVGRGKGIYK